MSHKVSLGKSLLFFSIILFQMFNCKYCNQSFQFLVENVGDKKTPAAVDQPHTDKSFYENLPFHGLKQPPTEVDSAWL